MANAKHGTLTGSAVTAVAVVADLNGLQIVNRTQTGAIYVRLDGVDPTVAGDDCFVVLGARHFPTGRTGSIDVRMISSDNLAYSVEGRVAVS